MTEIIQIMLSMPVRRSPVVFMVLLAAMSTDRNIHGTALMPRDDSPSIVDKFSALSGELPGGVTACYVPTPHTAEELRLFYLARYALAPRILVLENNNCRWTVGPDFHITVI